MVYDDELEISTRLPAHVPPRRFNRINDYNSAYSVISNAQPKSLNRNSIIICFHIKFTLLWLERINMLCESLPPSPLICIYTHNLLSNQHFNVSTAEVNKMTTILVSLLAFKHDSYSSPGCATVSGAMCRVYFYCLHSPSTVRICLLQRFS